MLILYVSHKVQWINDWKYIVIHSIYALKIESIFLIIIFMQEKIQLKFETQFINDKMKLSCR